MTEHDNSHQLSSTAHDASLFLQSLTLKSDPSATDSNEKAVDSLLTQPPKNLIHPTSIAGRERASSLASPFSFGGSLWTSSSAESLTVGSTALNTVADIWGNNNHSGNVNVSITPPTADATPRRKSWKCVGDVPLIDSLTSTASVTSVRPRSASIAGLSSGGSITSFASIVETSSNSASSLPNLVEEVPSRPLSTTGMQLPASLLNEELGVETAEEAAEIFKRSSMDSLLEFEPFSSLKTGEPSGSTLLSGLPRRHSVNWIKSEDGSQIGSSLFDFGNQATSSPPSSPEFDTFPEELVFNGVSSTIATATTNGFSKKRFARRHSIAADSLLSSQSLEDSFSLSSLSLNQSSAAGDLNEYPFNGNVMAAYSGLLQDEYSDLNSPTSSNNNSASVPAYAPAHWYSSGLPAITTPAQAGIAPTALAFPQATFQLNSHRGPLYLIEFKAGRTEIFYVLDADVALAVKVGDLVIVEADRGEDLGRITGEMSTQRIRQLISQLPHDSLASALASQFDESVTASGANVNHNLAGLKDFEIAALIASKEICPKRVHRLATPMDVRFLQAKAQEEALAMVRCQARIRQKKLPMDVVDAEYQWDRNKLTFYFAADRRIDFRELVRDLFRIYKTRIWMCAVDKNRAALLNSLAATYK